MALRSRNKASVNFSMSGMTDIVFLLLIFFMLTSTLIAPNALKLLFPQRGQTVVTQKQIPVVEIRRDGEIELDGRVIAFENLETLLLTRLQGDPEPAVSFIIQGQAKLKETVRVMNVAAKNNIKVVIKQDS
jgi:biopolymer transport protein ExbD